MEDNRPKKPMVVPVNAPGSAIQLTGNYRCTKEGCDCTVKVTASRWQKQNDPYYKSLMSCQCEDGDGGEFEYYNPKETEDYVGLTMPFSSLSKADQKKSLKKRSREHSRKNDDYRAERYISEIKQMYGKGK